MSFSDYLENSLMDHLFRKAIFTAPANLYVALFTSDPGETGASGEVTGTNYARVSTTGSDWSTSSGGQIDNDSLIEFNIATGSWGTVSHFGLWDSGSTGNFIGGGSVTSATSIGDGDTPRFPAGSLTVTLS